MVREGECESELGDIVLRREETRFFKWVKDNIAPAVESISTAPHITPDARGLLRPKIYPNRQAGSLGVLGGFVPATERSSSDGVSHDSGMGQSPEPSMFVFSSDYGQGSGKTETWPIGRVWSGASTDYEDNWQNISEENHVERLDWHSRVYLFDNVKFGGSAIEAAVTSEALAGHKMFVGTVKRPGASATFLITFNLPGDVERLGAAFPIIIKLGRPEAGRLCRMVAGVHPRKPNATDLGSFGSSTTRPNGSIDSKNHDR